MATQVDVSLTMEMQGKHRFWHLPGVNNRLLEEAEVADKEKKKDKHNLSQSALLLARPSQFLFCFLIFSIKVLFIDVLQFGFWVANFIVNRISDMEMRLKSHCVQLSFRIQIFLTIWRNLKPWYILPTLVKKNSIHWQVQKNIAHG